MSARDNHLLTGIARYLDCKDPLTATGGYYCCVARRKNRCDNREACEEPFIPEDVLDVQIAYFVNKLQLPEYVTSSLKKETERADKEYMEEHITKFGNVYKELEEISDRMEKLYPADTKKKRDNFEDLAESAKEIMLAILNFSRERYVYSWLQSISYSIGIGLDQNFSNLLSAKSLLREMFESIYVYQKEVVELKFSPIYGYAINWAVENTNWVSPYELVLDETSNLSIREYARYMIENNRSIHSPLIKEPTMQHQLRLEKEKDKHKIDRDTKLFLKQGILKNTTYKQVKERLESERFRDPRKQSIPLRPQKLESYFPMIKKLEQLRPKYYSTLIREFAETKNLHTLEQIIFDKPTYFEFN